MKPETNPKAAAPRRLGQSPQARRCPICGRDVPADGKSFPFCTERCRTIDLAKTDVEAARTLVQSGIGKQEMDRLRRLIGEMETEEQRLLDRREDRLMMVEAMVVGIILIFGLMVTVTSCSRCTTCTETTVSRFAEASHWPKRSSSATCCCRS